MAMASMDVMANMVMARGMDMGMDMGMGRRSDSINLIISFNVITSRK